MVQADYLNVRQSINGGSSPDTQALVKQAEACLTPLARKR
jgi:hypothetical protein